MSFGKRVLGVALGCAVMAGPFAEVQAQSPQPLVFGGELSKACAWPTVVLVHTFYPEKPQGQQYGLCTGTLVHPRVVIFASHCGDAIGVSVGLDRNAPNRIKEFEKVGRNPEWQNHPQYTKVDWAYAVLKEPLKGAATIPIAYGCELDMVQKQGQDVRLVGYSDNGTSGGALDPDKFVQRWAKAKITQLGGGVLFAGATGVGVHSGDSGGPILTQLKDGTWRTVGIVSRADGSSAAVGKEMVQWLTKETGIDVVPCFDDDGKPTESKECDALRAFSGDPTAPTAKPDNNCIGAPTKWAGLACGLDKSDGSDPNDEGSEDEDDKKKDEEDDKKKKGDEEDDKKKDEEDDKKKKGDDEDDKKKKGDEEDDDKKKKGDEEDDDKKKKGDDEDDDKKKKGDDEEDEQDDEDKKKGDDDSQPAPSGGCDVSSPASPSFWMLFGLLGVAALRRRRDRQ